MSLLEMYKNNFKRSNYHLGHMFMDCMKRRDPEGICTIDGATGEEETNASVLSRSIVLARCFRRLGLKPGDVLLLGGTLHIDIHIPYYAALLNGLPIVGVDPFFKYDEIKSAFKQTNPKIAFCQNASWDIYTRAAKDLGIDVKIVTFDEGKCTMSKLMNIRKRDDESADEFQSADFDLDKIYAWLVCTSGTTGLPKVAAFKHRVLIEKFIKYYELFPVNEERTTRVFNLSSVQWMSSFVNAIYYTLVNQCKLQTSRSEDIDHIVDVINKYRPASLLTFPLTMSQILKNEKHCDMTCFESVIITGSRTPNKLIIDMRSRMSPGAAAMVGYGLTETAGPVLMPNPRGPLGNCGVPMPVLPVKLVNPESGVVITEPNINGELWVKGLCFTEYLNNPEHTAKAFSEDGWYKSGDLFYRDENQNYFFVDRIKMVIKYRTYPITPQELENVILTLKSVQDVCVTSIPDPEDGQLPVACVVRRPGCDVTAQEIKDIVIDKLSFHKHLRGGVVFLDELPLTSTGKLARSTLQKIALEANRE